MMVCVGQTHTLTLSWHNFDWQTWSADDNPKSQNDRQLKLNTLMHFVGTNNLVLRPIIVFNNLGHT
jgi:hypothetical protein